MKKLMLFIMTAFSVSCLVEGQTDTSTLTKTGDKAPAFVCRTIDGKTIDISKQQGKIVMINFFATWCGPCNRELPLLQKNIWEKYKDDKNFVLVIIGREHNEKEVSDFVLKKKFTMPFAPDPKREIFSKYATQTIPRNIIIGKDGRIIFQNAGFSPDEFSRIEKLLAEKL